MTSALSKKIPRNILLFSMLKLNQEIRLTNAVDCENYIRHWNEIDRCKKPIKDDDLLKRREQYKEFINFQKKEDLYKNIVVYKECPLSKYMAQDAIFHYGMHDTKLLKKALRKESLWMWLKDYHIVYKTDRNLLVVLIVIYASWVYNTCVTSFN